MKNRINKITGELFTVIALTAALTGAVFAQEESPTEKTEKFRVRATEQSRRQVGQNTEKWTIKKAVEAKESYLSTVNRANFNLGSEFATALINAARLDEGNDAAKAAMIDLIYLIDSLEGQPEAAALEKTLKSIVRGAAKAAQVRLEIESASKSYSSRLASEQQWYFKSGTAVTELVFSTYASDDAAMKKDLSEIKELIKTAPPKTPGEIIAPMNNLAKYVATAAFAENDYATIFKSAVGLIGTINA